MSYDLEKVKLGREPITIVGVVVDKCSLTSGVGACAATQTGDNKCFETRAQCNDPANYTKTTKEYLFCEPRSSLPPGVNMFPVLDGKIQKASTSTTAGTGLGKRAVVTVKLKDFSHHDRGIDPYIAERSYKATALERGTFWGKFLKRNPYYEGRTIKIYHGYIGDTFSWSDFEIQEYDITDIKGPNDGCVTITAKDVLVRAYGNKSQYPALSTGSLLADITSAATGATLTPTGIGDSEYPASGTLAIGKEAILFTRLGDALAFPARAQWGTTAKEHKAGDTVQVCAAWDGTTNVIDVLNELLVTGAGLSSAYIPYADWVVEKDQWMTEANVKGILMKPESIDKVIAELSECFMFDIWNDVTAQKIKIKSLSPEASGVTINTLTEGSNIKQGSLKIDRKSKDRYTTIIVHFNKIDFSEDDNTKQFASHQGAGDAVRADADHYNGNSIKEIKSRWFDSPAIAAQLAGRLLARFADTPETVTFMLDNKDHGKLEMAGRVELNSWQFQDATGANESRKFQVLEIAENEAGHDFKVTCLTSSFSGNYFFFAPDDAPDYADATEEEKAKWGYFSDDTGIHPDGIAVDKFI